MLFTALLPHVSSGFSVGVFLAPVAVLSYAVLILAILRCVGCYWDIGPSIFEIEFVAPIHPSLIACSVLQEIRKWLAI